jgi:tetratricopeptide (TPR) repeat protein
MRRKTTMWRDRYDLPLTTSSDAAAAAYREAHDAMLSAWPGAVEALDRAIAADPAFALPYIARARVHQTYGEGAQARAKAARARELAAHATKRERQHVEVLAAAVEGRSKEALTGAEQHVEEFPRDALVFVALLGAYGLYAFSGRPDHDAARVTICERHAAHYGEDWWFLTYLGWSHTEAGNLPHGRAVTERALGQRRENAHAAHALAHAMFEQGDAASAEAFLADWLPGYDRRAMLNGHLSWHGALLALENGDPERALSLYNERIRPAVSHAAPSHLVADTASLLWRLGLYSELDLAPHWRDIAEYCGRTYPHAGVHFVDYHYALVAAATRDGAGCERRLDELKSLDAAGKLPPGPSLIALYRGIQSFADGDYQEAVRVLEPIMPDIVRLGGSHAQRELCEDTLIVACLRGGKPEKARAFIDNRLHRRPSRRDEAWRRQADGIAA